MVLSSVMNGTFDAVRGYAGSFTWGPLVSLSRNAVLSLLSRIEEGQLVLTDTDGTVTICGAPKPNGRPRTELSVQKDAFWVRLLLFADMV